MLVTSCGLKMGHHWGNIWMQDVRELVEASHLLKRECVGYETAVEQYYSTVRNVEGTGGRGWS